MEQDEGVDDMAQMMGFSAFGSQDRPQKKRKYNPNADSFVERQPPQAATTSSNSIPLGPPPVMTKPSANADEIDLEDDDGEDGSHAVKETAPGGGSDAQSGMNSLPRRPAVGAGEDGPSNGAHPGHGSRTQHNNRAAGHDSRGGKPWYDGYYDSISNENPWEKLEKAMNLQPIGGAWK